MGTYPILLRSKDIDTSTCVMSGILRKKVIIVISGIWMTIA